MTAKKFSAGLTILCFSTWVLTAVILERYMAEIFLGMTAPLVVGVATVLRVESIFQNSPEKLTAFMTKAFGGKMVLYALYLGSVFAFSAFNERPVLVSFVVYFVTLHMLEALFIRSVFKGSKARDESNGRE